MKKAVITGATGGLGEAIARKFASLGYELILIFSKNSEKAQLLKEELSAQVPVSIYRLDFITIDYIDQARKLCYEKGLLDQDDVDYLTDERHFLLSGAQYEHSSK